MARRRVHLLPRDVAVLELLAERRVETLNALHERLWADVSRKRAYNRLGELAGAGFLEHVTRSDIGEDGTDRPARQHLYVLGPRAPAALRLRDREAHTLALRRVRSGLSSALVEHQLATNRVGDWLGTQLLPESAVGAGLDRRQRPDGAYRAAADSDGRQLVLVEVDLGHYSRKRILAKAQGFLEHPQARDILFATPHPERADRIAGWVRAAYGEAAMRRIHVLAFEELQRGVALPVELAPAAEAERPGGAWRGAVFGPPGHR